MDLRILSTLIVFTAVFAAAAIRYATDYTPGDPLRLWSTRIAVLAIVIWIVGGLGRSYHSRFFAGYSFARYLLDAVAAIAVIWYAFRDEL